MSCYRRHIDCRLNNNSGESALSWCGRSDELVDSGDRDALSWRRRSDELVDNGDRGALRRYRRPIIY